MCRTNLGSPLLGTADGRLSGPISPGQGEDDVDGLSDTSACSPSMSARRKHAPAVIETTGRRSLSPVDAALYPRKRVAIACELCRLRKTRCDAKKPACSLCTELEIACVYKRPADQKRDQDGTSVLQRLDRIEQTLTTLVDALGPQSKPNDVASTYTEQSYVRQGPRGFSSSYYGTQKLVCKMPNLLTFQPPSKVDHTWSYDCTQAFFMDQLNCNRETLNAQAQRSPLSLNLNRADLLQLQRSFAENFLKWMPLFDHETASTHLSAAQATQHHENNSSLCVVLLMYAVGSISVDTAIYTKTSHELPGFCYYATASGILDHSTEPISMASTSGDPCHWTDTTDLTVLQCRILMAAYMLFAMRPLQAWQAISRASQECLVLLKTGVTGGRSREQFSRVYWICYVLENELEVCLELPPSGIREFEASVPLPTGQFEEEGLYYLLALSSLRKLMMEVVDTVGLKASAAVRYAPVVALELRDQIDDWYNHLPHSLRFPVGQSYLFDTRKAYLRCAYHALVAVVTWPFVLECENVLCKVGPLEINEEAQRTIESASECLKTSREYLEAAEEILMQKSLVSHLVVRAYFALTMILLLNFPATGGKGDARSDDETEHLLRRAVANLAYWEEVPFMHAPMTEMRRIVQLKGLL